MKKIFISLSILLLSLMASGQTMSDAILFGRNNYYGTARSVAMGNAMTAVGGDLGSIGINPAGSAVYGFSQFTVTPGLTFSGSNSAYSQSNFLTLQDNGTYMEDAGNFGASGRERYRKAMLPNIGLTLTYGTGNRYGIRNWTFSFLSNTTDSYVSRNIGSGVNECTSMLGYFASLAQYNCDGTGSIDRPSTLDYHVFENWDYPYDVFNREALAAYDSYMIGPDGRGGYAAATQGSEGTGAIDYPLAGPIRQTSIVQKSGSKHEYIMNFAANYEDRVFVGFNLGIPVFNYSLGEYFNEAAVDPDQFPVYIEDGDGTSGVYNFQKADYGYEYSAMGEGIYAKLGVIYVPDSHWRLGASIQTPTAYTIDEQWSISAATRISGYKHSASDVPVWSNTYSYRSPWIFNLGAAYTFWNRGLVSVDYELADYSVMRFNEIEVDYFSAGDVYYAVNRLNRLFCGVSHNLRLGLEYKITPEFAVRYGFNCITSPERFYRDSDGDLVDADSYDANFDYYDGGEAQLLQPGYMKSSRTSHSIGLGYSSDGAFFADLAVRCTAYPVSYYSPYGAYHTTDGGRVFTASPLIRTSAKVVDALLTVGWRF